MTKYRAILVGLCFCSVILFTALVVCCSGEEDVSRLIVNRYVKNGSLPDNISSAEVKVFVHRMSANLLSTDWQSAFSLEKIPVEAEILAKVDSPLVVPVLERIALSVSEPIRLRTCAFFMLEQRYYEKHESEVFDLYSSQVNGFSFDPFAYFHAAFAIIRISDGDVQEQEVKKYWPRIIQHSLLLFASSSDPVDKYHMLLVLRAIAARGYASWDEILKISEDIGGETLRESVVYHGRIFSASGGKLIPDILGYYKKNVKEIQTTR